MTRLLAAIALAVSLAVAPAARAQGPDLRLEALFVELQAATSSDEAAPIEARIWSVWYDYRGPVEDVRRLMTLGALAMQRGRLGAAEAFFDQVVALDPAFAEGWNRRATVRYMRGNFAGSVADIAETLLREPRHFGALSGLGLCYIALDRPAQALAAFEMALTVHPHLSGARSNAEALREALAGRPL